MKRGILAMAMAALAALADSASNPSEICYLIPRSGMDACSPPSPEATSISSGLSSSFDYCRGRASYSIPLFECRSGDASLSVSLSYATGGIKAEMAGEDFSLSELGLSHSGRVLSESFALWRGGQAPRSRLLLHSYDGFGRRVSTRCSVDGGQPFLADTLAYSPSGRLEWRSDGSGRALSYAYETYGALSRISGPSFTQRILRASGDAPLYSGTASAVSTTWASGPSTKYAYSYDGLGRLVHAAYSASMRFDPTTLVSGTPDYSAWFSYDLNSNPTSIRRKGVTDIARAGVRTRLYFGTIDDLSLSYTGNRLKKADDAAQSTAYAGAQDFYDGASSASEYSYDLRGRLVSDANRGIEAIEYNGLGLAQLVSFSDWGLVKTVYDASGALRSRLTAVPGAGQTLSAELEERFGPFVYAGGSLERVELPAGYVKDGEHFRYVLDWQGSVCQVLGESGAVVQENRYYPYGMLQGESSDIVRLNTIGAAAPAGSPRKYGGKELLAANGLNMHDFEARLQDFATCRFTTPDPRQWEYPYFSQYLYCAANPISFVDMLGLEPTPTEAARMCDFVYGDSEVSLEGGWVESSIIKYNISDSRTGLKCQLFEREKEDKTMEYTLAFAGTEINSGLMEFCLDAANDLLQLQGVSLQYCKAINLAKKINKDDNIANQITFTGHSLGGGLAAASAYAIGGRAITFNAAGISLNTKIQLISLNFFRTRIDAYITIFDPLNSIQNSTRLLQSANGNKHIVLPKSWNTHGIENFY